MIKTIFACLFLFSCTVAAPEAPPVAVKTYSDFWPTKEMQKAAVDALEYYAPNLKNKNHGALKDFTFWCYDPNDPVHFFNRLLSAMAKFESNYRAELEYKENFKNRKGEFVISTGLLQVSSESCAGYGMKYLSTNDLKKLENNLECAARILNKWVALDGVIAQEKLGAGRYWSVMRPTSQARAQIQKMVCGL